MSEEQGSQLSAMYDGELPQAECELLARRLSRDSALKAQWSRYALIGAAIRGEPTQAAGSVVGKARVLAVADRVALAIGAAPSLAAGADLSGDPSAMQIWLKRWAQPAAGVGVAAGVAALSIFWLQSRVADNATAITAQTDVATSEIVLGGTDMPEARDSLTLAAGGATMGVGFGSAPRVSNGEPVRYTVPAANPAVAGSPAASLATGQFANYVVAHSEYAAPMNRRNVLSALMASETALPLTPMPQQPVPQQGAPR